LKGQAGWILGTLTTGADIVIDEEKRERKNMDAETRAGNEVDERSAPPDR